MKITALFAILYLFVSMQIGAQSNKNSAYSETISILKKTPGLVALWDFKEKEGHNRKATGMGKFHLNEENGTLPRVNEGPLSGYSAQFGNKAFLSLENSKTGALNIFGENQGVTVIAWVKWEGNTGFVGGMWNEYQDVEENDSTDFLYPCRITTELTRFAGTSQKQENQLLHSHIPSITRQANSLSLKTNGSVWLLHTMENI